MNSIDRNGPCHCGSGKKYKKCCAWKDATARAAANPAPPPEEEFIAEIKPELDAQVNRLLERLERGERQGLKAQLWSLYEKHPCYHMTNYAIGIYVGMVEGDIAGAIPFFEKAVRILPPFAEAHYNLGCSLMKNCQIGPAVAAFRKAIRNSTADDGVAELAQERITALEKVILKSSPFATLEGYAENEQLFGLAFENLSKQRYGEAAEMFERALKQNPNHVQSHGNLGLCLAGLGRKAAALVSLDRALELDPAYEPARMNRKAVETMTEGEPFVPEGFAETEYYRERFEAEKADRSKEETSEELELPSSLNVKDFNAYLQRAREIIGERSPGEIEYDNAIVANLSAGMDIREAMAAANRLYPEEALKPGPEHWDDLAARYDYIREHKLLLRKLGIPDT
ncbi:MAG: hypothetical protein C5B50_10020 [Verrucomicrobia bacterium]|nr:MAG: hypothetical protein C5B50_10020 [Verrucomicrobiota bacterium]